MADSHATNGAAASGESFEPSSGEGGSGGQGGSQTCCSQAPTSQGGACARNGSTCVCVVCVMCVLCVYVLCVCGV